MKTISIHTTDETYHGSARARCKRSYLEIARDILEVAKTGAKPTALVYGANLNFNIIKKYLHELEEAGLISVDVIQYGVEYRLYTTTEKGTAFMDALDRAIEIYCSPMPIMGIQTETLGYLD